MSKAWEQVPRRPWSRVRRAVLERDGWTCQLRRPGCLGVATTVDHIVPVSVDVSGALDPTNLRASCSPCNQSRNRKAPTRARIGW